MSYISPVVCWSGKKNTENGSQLASFHPLYVPIILTTTTTIASSGKNRMYTRNTTAKMSYANGKSQSKQYNKQNLSKIYHLTACKHVFYLFLMMRRWYG